MRSKTTPPRFTPPAQLDGFDAVLFDCDGTLADSMPAHFIAWQRGLTAAGARFDFSWEEFLSRAGMSLDRTVDELEQKYECSLNRRTLAEVKATVFAELETSIVAISEVTRFAREIAGRVPVAVVSGSSRRNVVTALEQVKVRDLFEVIVTPEDVEHGKPHPDMFLLAAKKLGVDPARCLVLEDGASGIEAARRASMACIVVRPASEP